MKFSSWNIICFAQKEPIKVQFFKLLSVLMNVHPNPHAIFEITRSGFLHTLHHCSVSWKITPLYCCSSNLRQKGHIKKKFFDFWAVGRKFTKFLMSYLKPQVSFFFFFFFQLCITLQCHERFQTLDCSREISPNFHFDRLLLLKVYEVSAKRYRGFMTRDTEE